MKTIFTTCLLVLCFQHAIAQFDIRGVNWGASKLEVKKSEKGLKIDSEDKETIMYKANLSGTPYIITYNFIKDKLYKVIYIYNSNESYSSTKTLIEYKNVRNILIKKYGNPVLDLTEWKDTYYKNDEYMWSTALNLGHVKFHLVWKNEKTTISEIALTSDNSSNITFGIVYISNKLSELYKADLDKEETKDF